MNNTEQIKELKEQIRIYFDCDKLEIMLEQSLKEKKQFLEFLKEQNKRNTLFKNSFIDIETRYEIQDLEEAIKLGEEQ